MKKFVCIMLGVTICFVTGLCAGMFQSASIETWYPTLVKSAFTPPNRVFPVACGIIYICMGTSIGLVWGSENKHDKRLLTHLFAMQLILNILWSICFFLFRSPMLGLITIVVIDIAAIWYLVRLFYHNCTSAFLLTPYITWLTLATYLNAYIVSFN